MEGQHGGTFGNGTFHLFCLSGHILLTAAVDAGDGLGTQADSAAGAVHCHIAAADDGHILAGEVGHFAVADGPEHLHGGDDVLGILALNAHLLVGVGTDGQIHGIILASQLLEADIHANFGFGVDFNAQGQDGGDFAVQLFSGVTVAGDAVAHHAAQLLVHVVNRYLVAHQSQVVCGGEAGGAAANHRNGLAGGFGAGRIGHITGHIHSKALQTPDVDGAVHHLAAAAVFAGMLADVGAGNGEGIVLADQADSIGIAAFVDQGHITGDIHGGGALGHAGNGVFQTAKAAAGGHMLLEIVPEGDQSIQHQLTGINADGAVGGVHDHLGGGLDPVQDLRVGFAVQHFTDHLGKLIQTDPAGGTFAAGLGLAQAQEVQRHIHRAQTGRIGINPTFHAAVDLFNDRLGLSRHSYFKSTHIPSYLSWSYYSDHWG